jgi:HEPN domain-containing protein
MKLTPFILEWIRRAEQDQKLAAYSLKDSTLLEQACFHSEQLAEKYLKSYLIFHKSKFDKTHNLIHLVKMCQELDKTFKELETDAELLNQFYIESRYPSGTSEFDVRQARSAFAAAKRIKQFVIKQLS